MSKLKIRENPVDHTSFMGKEWMAELDIFLI